MAYSTQRATSDGTLQNLSLEIKFIDRVNVAVFVDDVPQVPGVDFEWVDDTIIHFTNPVPNGSEVLLQRNTALANVLNIFTLGAVFDNPTMDENFQQLLYIAQEAREGSTLEEVFRNLNMHGFRIQNLGAGTEPGDAINWQQYMDDSLGAGGARVAAEAARDAAVLARDAAQAAQGTASTAAGTATSAASAAAISEGTASAAATTAVSARDTAIAQAAAAADAADEAEAAQAAAEVAVAAVESAQLPMFGVLWWPQRTAIPNGFVAADGQALSRSTYPQASAGVLAGNVPTATDAAWLADPLERGKYTVGDGSTTFRLPDYNGKFAGSLGAVFMRGDGTLSAGVAGAIQRDQLGPMQYANHMSPGTTNVYISNVSGTKAALPRVEFGSQAATVGAAPDESKWVTNTGDETRPLNVTGCWIIKLFGAVTEVGSANAAQLASDYANLASRTTAVESKVAALEAGIKQTPELLWSGNAGTVGNVLTLSRSLQVGDVVWVVHEDATKFPSCAIVMTADKMVPGTLFGWSFGQGGGSACYFNGTNQLTVNLLTSGYPIGKVYASRAKN